MQKKRKFLLTQLNNLYYYERFNFELYNQLRIRIVLKQDTYTYRENRIDSITLLTIGLQCVNLLLCARFGQFCGLVDVVRASIKLAGCFESRSSIRL